MKESLKRGQKVLRLRVLLATTNPDKRKEILAILRGLPTEVVLPREIGISLDVKEDGASLLENAKKKALAFARESGLAALAEDTGLEVDALGGAPGVFSARYAGENATYAQNYRKLLGELRGVPPSKRTCRFRTVVVLARRGRVLITAEGTVRGRVSLRPHGSGGFGYDPVFFYPPLGKTFAQLLPYEKNHVSHRARALREFRKKLRLFLTTRERFRQDHKHK